MVKQRSPRAGPMERSSGRHTLPKGIALRIALSITLRVLWFIILVRFVITCLIFLLVDKCFVQLNLIYLNYVYTTYK